jgi:hypothetical protein
MATLTTAKLELAGKSGKKYSFSIYPIDEECKDESGIYAFTKRMKENDGSFTHYVIYIGKAKSFETRFYDHHKDDCIDKKGANCLCLMKVSAESDREEYEKDLIRGQNPPCNEVHRTN